MYFCWTEDCPEPRCLKAGDGGELLQAASGERHSLLLFSNHRVYSCGDNSLGQLGQLGQKRKQNTEKPEQIKALATLHVDLVSCGKEHSIAVCHKGRVFAWGAGSEGQLGIGECKEINLMPTKIKALDGIRIIQVSCGHYHSLALSEDGQVFSWGSNSQGQLGLGRTYSSQASPQRVKSLKGIPLAQVAAGGTHSFALSLMGTSYGWGNNSVGQLALSGKKAKAVQIHKPFSIGALKSLGVVYISCGYEHTAVLTKDGQVFTFGDSRSGQLLQQSPQSERRGPQLMEGIGGPVSMIKCGSYHTLAYVHTTGKVVSLGHGPSLTSNPTNQEAPAENSDVTCLLSEKDFVNIQVKDIFAGAYANFATTHRVSDPRSTSVSMKILREINRINESLVHKWIAAKRNKEREEAKREISIIFSSSACLTASFWKKRDNGEKNFIDVDLKMARDVFKKLSEVPWISSLIITCLQDKIIKDLPYDSLHQDALLVFLLLPECPMMQDPRNFWKTLTVEFAKAIYKMNTESFEFLQKCWKSLEVSSLSALVQMLKNTIIIFSQHPGLMMQDQHSLKVLLEVMKSVHKVNHQLPASTFIINELSAVLNPYVEEEKLFLKYSNQLPSESPDHVVLSDFLFSFDLPSKLTLMQCNSTAKLRCDTMAPQGTMRPVLLTLRVRRSHLVEDAMRQLGQAEYSDLRKPLTIEFINEVSAKSAGVSSEFFHYIFEEMTDPKYGMFVYPEKNIMWFPVNPKFEKKRYFLFGILCGLALSNLKAVKLPFPLALYKKLLNKKTTLEDLKELSIPLGKSLQEVLNCKADDFEELYINFSIHWDQKDDDLIPNGSSVPVNQTNRQEYVSMCVDYIFNTSVKMIYEEFHRGFYTVCNLDIIRQFLPEELMEAIIGNADCDWKQFENNSLYADGYHKAHPTILLFWKAFHELTSDEKKKFLLFLTGCDRFHIHSLQFDRIIFRCPQTFSEEDNPRSLTCHNILDLPKYSTMERMKEALQVMINNNKGFASWT